MDMTEAHNPDTASNGASSAHATAVNQFMATEDCRLPGKHCGDRSPTRSSPVTAVHQADAVRPPASVGRRYTAARHAPSGQAKDLQAVTQEV